MNRSCKILSFQKKNARITLYYSEFTKSAIADLTKKYETGTIRVETMIDLYGIQDGRNDI